LRLRRILKVEVSGKEFNVTSQGNKVRVLYRERCQDARIAHIGEVSTDSSFGYLYNTIYVRRTK